MDTSVALPKQSVGIAYENALAEYSSRRSSSDSTDSTSSMAVVNGDRQYTNKTLDDTVGFIYVLCHAYNRVWQ